MPRFVVRTTSEQSTQECGRKLGPLLMAQDVLLLSGDLGAGKTQLTKGIARGLGVDAPVTSPTFNILLVREGRLPLYHFDLYRLERPGELEDLDYFGTLESDGVSVVEWGDRFPEARPADCLSVTLLIEGDEQRRIEIDASGPRSEQLATQWAEACSSVEGASVGVLGECVDADVEELAE